MQSQNRRGKARDGEARIALSLPNDPRSRRAAQSRLTQSDFDPDVLEVVNGKVTLKAATGDRRLVASSADGITMSVTKKGTFRVSAVDGVRQIQLSSATISGAQLDEKQMSDRIHRLSADVALLTRTVNEMLSKFQQGAS